MTDLTTIKTRLADSLRTSCRIRIEHGFEHEGRQYPADVATQLNVQTAALAGAGASLWCSNGTEWSFVEHTAAEIDAVLTAMHTHVHVCRARYAVLLTHVNAAETHDELFSLQW